MVAGYGLAEATVGVSMWSPRTPNAVDDRGIVSVGSPFPGVDLLILGEHGPATAGEVGEILVRSPANTSGYFLRPDASRDLFWGDGFLHTAIGAIWIRRGAGTSWDGKRAAKLETVNWKPETAFLG